MPICNPISSRSLDKSVRGSFYFFFFFFDEEPSIQFHDRFLWMIIDKPKIKAQALYEVYQLNSRTDLSRGLFEESWISWPHKTYKGGYKQPGPTRTTLSVGKKQKSTWPKFHHVIWIARFAQILKKILTLNHDFFWGHTRGPCIYQWALTHNPIKQVHPRIKRHHSNQ